ncbi:MAG: hypothetical protein ACP5RW_04760 [bacterium]
MKKLLLISILLLLLGLVDKPSKTLLDEYISSIEPPIDYSATMEIRVGNSSDKVDVLKIGSYTSLSLKYNNSKIYVIKKGEEYSIVSDVPVNIGALLWAYRFSKDVSLILKNYDVIFDSYETIDKMKTMKISFNPKYETGIKRTVWISESPRILVKLEDRDYNGNLIRTKEMMDIKFNPSSEKKKVIESLFNKGIKIPERETLLSPLYVSKELGFNLVIPNNLPSGYQLIGADIPQEGIGQLVFTDGIGFISLYQIKVPWWARENTPPEEKEVIEWEDSGIHFILVGDLSPEKLVNMVIRKR